MADLEPPPPYSINDPHPPTSDTTPLPLPPPSVPRLESAIRGGNQQVTARSHFTLGKPLGPPKENQKPKGKTNESLSQALYGAVSKQDIETIQYLLQKGADPNWRPCGGKPSLIKAVSDNNVTLLQTLLECEELDLDATAPGGAPALYTALANGYIEVVRLLLDRGANADCTPPGGQPALYKAYDNNYTEIVWLLLDSEGIRVDATPPGGSSTLYKAAENGDKVTVRALLSVGASVDVRPPGGVTAMYRAAGRGDIEMAEILLMFGAKVDVTPPGGTTAIWHATKAGNVALVRLLLSYGADINASPPGGKSVLVQAVKSDKSKDRAILQMLLKYDGQRKS